MKTLNSEAFRIAFRVLAVGVTMRTPVYIRQRRLSVLLEARVGIAANDRYKDQGDLNPFDIEFEEQYCFGTGRTEEEALEKLKRHLISYSQNTI